MSSDPYEVSPSFGLYQLQAQVQVYKFLVSCLQDLLDYSGSDEVEEAPRNDIGSNDCLSLLTCSSRLDYYGRSKTINLRYLDSLLQAALVEAQDDLWQQRNDREFWIERLQRTPPTSPGRAPNLLRAIFVRIDTFHNLCRHANTLKEHDWFNSSTISSSPSEVYRLLAFLDVALLSMLEEEMGRLQNIEWRVEDFTSTTISRLLNMVKMNHPDIRVVGLPKLMTILDREISKDGAQDPVPFAVMQALHNISVLAVCEGETSKH